MNNNLAIPNTLVANYPRILSPESDSKKLCKLAKWATDSVELKKAVLGTRLVTIAKKCEHKIPKPFLCSISCVFQYEIHVLRERNVGVVTVDNKTTPSSFAVSRNDKSVRWRPSYRWVVILRRMRLIPSRPALLNFVQIVQKSLNFWVCTTIPIWNRIENINLISGGIHNSRWITF